MRTYRRWLAALLLPIVAGCAMPGKIASEMQMRPNHPEAGRLRSIAILRFDATGHQDITPDVEAALTSATFEGRPYFTVVERRRLDEALRELRLASSGALDPSTAAKLGQMIAAKGVYMGSIARDDVADQRFRESRKVCAEKKLERDKKGALYEGACARWTETEVSCTRRTASFEFIPKLVDVARGTVIYSRAIATSDSSTVCQDEQTPLPLPHDMRRRVRVAAVNLFREDVAPYSKPIEIAYLTSSEGISSPAAKERFEGSIAFARGNRLDRACEVWGELANTEGTSASITFNNGACAEVAGDFARADQLYTAADRMLTRPDKTVSDSLRRIRERQGAESQRTVARPTAPTSQPSAPAMPLTAAQARTDRPAETQSGALAGGPQSGGASAPLGKGSIAQAQAKLNAAGYPVGVPDGALGPRTKAAIRKFQADQKIPATGELDAATMRALGLN